MQGKQVLDAYGHKFPSELRVYAIDLNKLPNPGSFELTRRGTYVANRSSTFELFQGDIRFKPARWPQEGFSKQIELSADQTSVILPQEIYNRFADEPFPWIGAYWTSDFAFETSPVTPDIAESYAYKFARLHAPRAIRKQFPYYFFNTLGAIAKPGDYVLDHKNHVVYAVSTNSSGDFEIAIETNLLELNSVHGIRLSGLKFDKALGTALIIKDSHDVTVDGCDIRHMGISAITVEGGSNVVISNCKIEDIAETAVKLSGGDRMTLTPANHAIRNSEISGFDLDARTYHPAIDVIGVGINIEDNLIEDSPHSAILLHGNDHTIRRNRIRNVITEADDAGAIYVGRDWTERGTIIENNWFSDIGIIDHPEVSVSAVRKYVSGVYLDDQASGYIIRGNIFDNVSWPVFIHGGRDNTVTNNVFLRCKNKGIWLVRRGEGLKGQTLQKRLEAIPYETGVWASKYPALRRIKSEQPAEPINNKASGNIAIGCDLFGFANETNPALWPDIAKDSKLLPLTSPSASAAELLKDANVGCDQIPLLCTANDKH